VAVADAARRRLTLDASELGVLGALAGGAAEPLRGRTETAHVMQALERAGVLERGVPVSWTGAIGRVVAGPLVRMSVDAFLAPASVVAHRVWVGDDGAVLGRAVGERFELAWVEAGLVVPALLRALDVPEGSPASERVLGPQELPGRRWAWRAQVPDREPLIVLDGGADGLWSCRVLARERFAVAGASRGDVARRLAELLGGGAAEEPL
jgi:hypothetical protein